MKAKLLLTASALALASSLAFGGQAYAQADQAQTVNVCGTPNNTPVVGQVYPMTMDKTGTLCTVAGGGGGGGNVVVTSGNLTSSGSGNSTIVAPLGSSVSASSVAVVIASDQAAVSVKGSLTSGGNVTVTNTPAVTVSSGNVAISNSPAVTITSGTTTVTQATGTNLHTVVDSGNIAISNTPGVTVSSGNVTSTISGNVNITGNLTAGGAVTNAGTFAVQNTVQGESAYANRANWIGNTTTVANTTGVTLTPSPGAGNSIFLTDISCINSGATQTNVTLNDSPATILITPAGGGMVIDLKTPHAVAGNTALTVTLSANTTSVSCTDSGYKATT